MPDRSASWRAASHSETLLPGSLPFRRARLPNWDDWDGLPFGDGRMATTGVIGTVGSDRVDPLDLWDLAEQLGQDRTVTIAAWGELYGLDVRGRLIMVAFHLSDRVFDGRRIDIRALAPISRLGGPFFGGKGEIWNRPMLQYAPGSQGSVGEGD
jgi:hypothetical protein